jgi:metal-sulfur cluster biosynthetic enzyme
MDDHAEIWRSLRRVVDPCSIATGVPIDIVNMGLVKAVRRDADRIVVQLRLTSPVCWQAARILSQIEEVLSVVPGVTEIVCNVDPYGEWMPDMITPETRKRLRTLRPVRGATP